MVSCSSSMATPVADGVIKERLETMIASLQVVGAVPEESTLIEVATLLCRNGFQALDGLDGIEYTDLQHIDKKKWSLAHKGFAIRVLVPVPIRNALCSIRVHAGHQVCVS